MSTQTDILPEEDLELSEPDDIAHWVRIKQLVQGGPQVALCGKKWIPKTAGADVLEKKVCPKCKELYALLEMMNM